MKKIIFVLTIMLAAFTGSYAQQTVKPTIDKEVKCQLASIDDEGTVYDNVIVKFKCTVKFAGKTCQTKIVICNAKGKKITKRILSDALLYVFDSGQIQVGKNGVSKVLVYKDKSGNTVGKVRESEGVILDNELN